MGFKGVKGLQCLQRGSLGLKGDQRGSKASKRLKGVKGVQRGSKNRRQRSPVLRRGAQDSTKIKMERSRGCCVNATPYLMALYSVPGRHSVTQHLVHKKTNNFNGLTAKNRLTAVVVH